MKERDILKLFTGLFAGLTPRLVLSFQRSGWAEQRSKNDFAQRDQEREPFSRDPKLFLVRPIWRQLL